MAALLSFLIALLRAVPALESLVRQALAERDKERERAAAQRLEDKNAAVAKGIAAAQQGKP